MPKKWYGNEDWSTFEVECGLGAKGKAMIWDNRHLVHRVRMLKNRWFAEINSSRFYIKCYKNDMAYLDSRKICQF